MTSPRRENKERRGEAKPAASEGAPAVELYTLGSVHLVQPGPELTSNLGPKHLALLVYLYHEQRPMHPSEVIDLLGRGQQEEKEVAALKRAVAWLAEHVPGADIHMTSDSIEGSGGVWMDAREVDAAIDRGDPAPVAEFYSGEFLENFESGAPAFDEWAQRERGRLRRAWTHAMIAAARQAERREHWETAIGWWEILVRRAPMRPEPVAGLLRAFAECGLSDAAAQAYSEYAARLERSGIAQPAEAVRRVLADYPALKELSEKAGPPVGESRPAAARGAPTSDSERVSEAETEAEAETGAEAETEAEAETDGESAAEADASVQREEEEEPAVGGEQTADVVPPEPPSGEEEAPGDEEWEAVVDIATGGELGFASDSVAEGVGPEVEPEELDVEAASEPAAPGRPGEPGVLLGDHKWEPPPAPPGAAEEGKSGAAAGSPYEGAEAAFVDADFEPPARGAASVDETSAGVGAQEGAAATAREKVFRLGWGAGGARRSDIAGRGRRLRIWHTGRDALRSFGSRLRRPGRQPRDAAVEGYEDYEVTPWHAAYRGGPRFAWLALMRRYWYAPLALLVVTLLVVPRLLSDSSGAASGPQTASSSALPKVPLPKVSVPRVSVKTPAFVETSVSKIGAMLSGPILEAPGQWVLVADMEQIAGETVEPNLAQKAAAVSPSGEMGTLQLEPLGPEAVTGDSAGRQREDSTLQAGGVAVIQRGELAPAAGAADTTNAVDTAGRSLTDSTAPGEDSAVAFSQGTAGDRAAGGDSARPDIVPAEPAAALGVAPAETLVAGPGAEGAAPAQTAAAGADSAEAHRAGSGDSASAGGPLTVPADTASPAALTVALEADLSQATFFRVVPRERALTALTQRTGRVIEELGVEDALALAEAEGYAAVISGRVKRRAGADSLELQVLSSAGDTLYGVTAEVTGEIDRLQTLAALARAVRRRLGEPAEEIEQSLRPVEFLTNSPAALNAYARARRFLYVGRYPQAVRAAREATRRDTTFAMAYVVLAQAYAEGGARALGRSALERAWQLSGRVAERERMRIEADRLAWDGRFSEAAIAYDELFQRYRDDVGALKSQAILQRLIGARGMGEGNLRVAYSLDRFDWPPLHRIARYLGYEGALPDVDSLVASLEDVTAGE